MNTRSFLTLSLLAVVLTVSCAPVIAPAPAQPEAPAQPAPPASEAPAQPTPLEPPPALTEAPPTQAPVEAPQAVATSRGPDLEASDPATASLASGDLQLVEFFRFT